MADPAAPTVSDFGGEELPNGGVRLLGWRFEVSEGAIASTAQLAQLKDRLRAAAETSTTVPKLPEAVFMRNKLTVTHERTGTRFAFDAEDALAGWLRKSLADGAGGLTIAAAELGTWKDKVQKSGDAPTGNDWDWTYSTTYVGKNAGADGDDVSWSAHEGSGIDMAMLKRREPILFFADLPLYTDDLHDNGVSEARVRIRVMPSCFFVLYRHFLRVDGQFIRQTDARLFCKLSGGAPLLRMRRVAQAPLPPMPTTPAEVDDAGRLVQADGMVPPATLLPDEQRAAERLAAVSPEMEVVEEVVLD